MKTKVKIICPKHGIFEQIPNSHFRSGCPKCGIEKKSIKQKIGIKKFIERSNKTHKNKYDYSLVKYVNCKTKVKIICPIHGIFEQIPDHHYRGVGCPHCSKTYGGDFSKRYLYIFYDYKYNLMKIGVSKNPEKRLKEISKGKDRTNLKLIRKYKHKSILENKIHKHFKKFNTEHELFEDGKTEWFKIHIDDIYKVEEIIKEIIKEKSQN